MASSTVRGRKRSSAARLRSVRRSARLQAKALISQPRLDYRPLSSESSSQTAKLSCNECVSLSLSKMPKEKESVNMEKSGNESIASLKDSSWIRESDQNSLSNTSAELHATIRNFSEAVSPLAQEDSPTAPSRRVTSNAIVGEKTEECNNTRLARTSFETNSASEGTSSSENFNSQLGAQHQGRKESDQDALITSKDVSGTAAAVIASDNTSGRQLALEEVRVLPDVANGMPTDVNNVTTTDEPLGRTYSTGLSEFANLFPEDVSNQDEVQSFDPALVTVEGYRVKEASAPILRDVMEKHGDISMNCIVETVDGRSFFLEKLCEIMQTLQTTKFEDITQTEVKKMLALVADLGRVNLDVEWLRKRLEEIVEAIELIRQFPRFKESRKQNAQTIQTSEGTLKIYEARIREYEAQIQALKEMARWEKEKMDAAEAEDRDIIQKVSNLKPKVKRFIKESLLHDL
ncbi:hypothetical protein PTKIN_Ptkin07bG0296800 [Pterospermum kingtungense]